MLVYFPIFVMCRKKVIMSQNVMVFMSDVQKFGQNRSRNAQIQYKDRAFQFLSMDRNDLNLNTRGSHVKPRDHCIIVYNAICHGETVLFSSSSLF